MPLKLGLFQTDKSRFSNRSVCIHNLITRPKVDSKRPSMRRGEWQKCKLPCFFDSSRKSSLVPRANPCFSSRFNHKSIWKESLQPIYVFIINILNFIHTKLAHFSSRKKLRTWPSLLRSWRLSRICSHYSPKGEINKLFYLGISIWFVRCLV